MSDQDAFLRTIIDSPLEDAPRLVYADWLEEDGKTARAEFIRVQCELGAHPFVKNIRTGDYDARDGIDGIWVRGFSLHDRERELISEPRNFVAWVPLYLHQGAGVGIRWNDGLIEIAGGCVSAVEFRRGFIERLTIRLADLLTDGKPTELALSLIRRLPLTRVEVGDKRPWTDADAGGEDYGWWDENNHRLNHDGPNDPGNLPTPLFNWIWESSPDFRLGDAMGRWLTWKSAEAANEALSRAIIDLLRAEAKLPAIRWPEPAKPKAKVTK